MSRWGGLAAVVVFLAVVTLSLQAGDDGRSTVGVPVGTRLPPFAVPLALSDLEGDANVARRPDAGEAGAVPACRVRGPRVLNGCQLAERGPVALAFFTDRGGECTRELDRLQAAARVAPGVQLAAVALRGERDDVRRLVRGRRWRFPVGHDRDAALGALFGVAVCPQITLALPGGEVRANLVGPTGDAELRGRLGDLVRAARAQGWRAPR